MSYKYNIMIRNGILFFIFMNLHKINGTDDLC